MPTVLSARPRAQKSRRTGTHVEKVSLNALTVNPFLGARFHFCARAMAMSISSSLKSQRERGLMLVGESGMRKKPAMQMGIQITPSMIYPSAESAVVRQQVAHHQPLPAFQTVSFVET
jgi:hypothetical protein